MPQHEFPEENHTRSIELSCFKVTLQNSKKVMIEKCIVIFVKQDVKWLYVWLYIKYKKTPCLHVVNSRFKWVLYKLMCDQPVFLPIYLYSGTITDKG